jgi:hypothetical protein
MKHTFGLLLEMVHNLFFVLTHAMFNTLCCWTCFENKNTRRVPFHESNRKYEARGNNNKGCTIL